MKKIGLGLMLSICILSSCDNGTSTSITCTQSKELVEDKIVITSKEDKIKTLEVTQIQKHFLESTNKNKPLSEEQINSALENIEKIHQDEGVEVKIEADNKDVILSLKIDTAEANLSALTKLGIYNIENLQTIKTDDFITQMEDNGYQCK